MSVTEVGHTATSFLKEGDPGRSVPLRQRFCKHAVLIPAALPQRYIAPSTDRVLGPTVTRMMKTILLVVVYSWIPSVLLLALCLLRCCSGRNARQSKSKRS